MLVRPHNPIYVIITALLPWRWRKTYVQIHKDTVTFSRYYCFDGKSLKRDVTTFSIKRVRHIGFPEDWDIPAQEKAIQGAYGVYVSQEILFETEEAVISFNARPYTKKQIRLFLDRLRSENPSVVCGDRLAKIIAL